MRIDKLFYLCTALTVFALVSCTRAVQPRVESLMGTVCTVNAYEYGTQELYDELFTRIAEIENDFSVNIASSYIAAINNAAGQRAVAVSADVFFVVKAALQYAELTDGAFDPTVGPLVKLWGINTDSARVPQQQEIDNALPLVNWRNVTIAENADGSGSVLLSQRGMSLDLGGIVKGYAADELVKILQKRNVKRAIIDLGGNVFVYGKKKDGALWRVGVKDPDFPEGAPALIARLTNSTVVTSGVYERFFVEDGIRYHHILDTKTGCPADAGLLSTTIICESSMAADALSTSVFALGKERGMALLKKIAAAQHVHSTLAEIPGLHARVLGIFIDDAGAITASQELESALESLKSNVIFE